MAFVSSLPSIYMPLCYGFYYLLSIDIDFEYRIILTTEGGLDKIREFQY